MNTNYQVLAYDFSPLDTHRMYFTFKSEELLEEAMPYLMKLKPNGILIRAKLTPENSWMLEEWSKRLW